MARRIRVLNWNIQNYGPRKSGFADINAAIAKVVVEWDADIFVMLELNTTSVQTATNVAQAMRDALVAEAGQAGRPAGEWQTCVLSPNTGKEFYGFFVRDTAVTIPMPITAQAGMVNPPAIVGGAAAPVTGSTFTGWPSGGVTLPDFPLFEPDLGAPPYWPGTRRPVFAPFYVNDATIAEVDRMLPIIACHFSAKGWQAARQIAALQTFSFLADIGQMPRPILQGRKSNTAAVRNYVPNGYVLLGDFNIDYLTSTASYNPLTQAANLGAQSTFASNSHLVTPNVFSPRDFKTTDSLLTHAYDNIFVKAGLPIRNNFVLGASNVADLAKGIMNRFLSLRDSVADYQELDQRGFSSQTYQYLVSDAAGQLTGDKSMLINLKSSLIGARLISDHAPVVTDVTMA